MTLVTPEFPPHASLHWHGRRASTQGRRVKALFICFVCHEQGPNVQDSVTSFSSAMSGNMTSPRKYHAVLPKLSVLWDPKKQPNPNISDFAFCKTQQKSFLGKAQALQCRIAASGHGASKHAGSPLHFSRQGGWATESPGPRPGPQVTLGGTAPTSHRMRPHVPFLSRCVD